MKAERRHTMLFAVCLIFFLVHQYLQKAANISIPFVDSYLDPFLFMPILLYLIVWERRLLFGDFTYSLPASYIFGYFMLVSILCEIVLPLWNDRMTADVWDVLFYAVGTLTYVAVKRDIRCLKSELIMVRLKKISP